MTNSRKIAYTSRVARIACVGLALVTVFGASPVSAIPPREQASAALVRTQGSPSEQEPVSLEKFNRKVKTVTAGQFSKIYDPSVYSANKGVSVPWLINDHTFIQADDGTWHLFGITHKEPPAPGIMLAHATAPSLHGPWTKQPMVMRVDRDYHGETHVWAPHVIQRGGTYYMFYSGGGDDPTANAISLATSKDLFHWKRHPEGPLFRDGWGARDPMVRRVGDRWVMYYEATRDPSGGKYVVAYRTSSDLLNWSERHIAFTSPDTGKAAGNTESPFVAYHHGSYYLFIGPCGGYRGERTKYNCTDVYRSDSPLHFSRDKYVGRISAHAPEIVQDADGTPYISHAGWSQGGVHLGRLYWDQQQRQRGVRIATPEYKAELLTSPMTKLTSLRRATSEGYGRNLLDTGYRGTRPFVGIGGWGNLLSGQTRNVRIDRQDKVVKLNDIQFGRQPITVDWTFKFSQRWFDMSFRWTVTGRPDAPVYAAGWTLDTALPELADNLGRKKKVSTPYGFPNWTMGTNGSASLVSAYERGSSWQEYARYFNPHVGAINWRSISSEWGYNWSPGVYRGGTWRVGISDRSYDTAYAEHLYATMNG